MKYKGSQDTTASQPYVDYGGRNTSAFVAALENKAIKNHPAVTIPKATNQLEPLHWPFGLVLHMDYFR